MRTTLECGQFPKSIGLLLTDSFGFDQLVFDLSPGHFVKLVNRTANGFKLRGITVCLLDHHFENFPMVNFDQEAIHSHGFQNFLHDSQDFRVRDHGVIFASDVEIALVKLSESALVDCGLIPSINFSNMESLYFLDIGVVGHEPGEGNSEIVSQTALLATLVLQIVDKFGVFSVFTSENLFEFKDRSVNLDPTMLLKNFNNCINDFPPNGHLVRVVITSAFGGFDFETKLSCLGLGGFCLVSLTSLLLFLCILLGIYLRLCSLFDLCSFLQFTKSIFALSEDIEFVSRSAHLQNIKYRVHSNSSEYIEHIKENDIINLTKFLWPNTTPKSMWFLL